MTLTDAEILERARRALPRQAQNRVAHYWAQQQRIAVEQAELHQLEMTRAARRSELNLRKMRHRRWWRLGEALLDSGDNARAILSAPARVARAVTTREDPPDDSELVELEHTIEARRNRLVGARLHGARVALANRRYPECDELTRAILEEQPDLLSALEIRSQLLERTGELSAAHMYLRLLRDVWDTEELARRDTHILAQIGETDTRWAPVGSRVTRRIEPVSDRVLHVIKESRPYLERGYTVRTHSNLLASAAAGFEPVVVTPLGFPRELGVTDFESVETIDGIRHHRLDLGRGYLPAHVPLTEQLENWTWLLEQVVAEERPEFIHAGSGHRGYETALVGLSVARRFGLRLVYEVRSSLEQTWTSDIAISERGETFARRMAQERRCMEEADAVLVISESLRADVLARGIDPAKVFLLPNGVDLKTFSGRDRHAGSASAERAVIGYISNLGTREGFLVLLEAIAELRRRGRDIRGLVVGEGPRRPEIEARMEELGLEDHVTLTGAVPHDEVAKWYTSLDFFVVPRIEERASRLITPLKPFEAMALGVPVICADLPALAEIVDPPRRGFVFAAGDPLALADTVEYAMGRPEDAAARARRAAAWIESERQWEANGPRLAAAYEYARRAAT